jgi:hypothetical protein
MNAVRRAAVSDGLLSLARTPGNSGAGPLLFLGLMGALLILPDSVASAQTPSIQRTVALACSTNTVGQFEKLEFVFDFTSGCTNPFDPEARVEIP